MPSAFTFELPDWVQPFIDQGPGVWPTVEERMRFVIALSRKNIEHNTGGPFGAAIFDDQGKLVAPGVNLVTTANCSILHAEMVAIALAQQTLGRYDLSDGGKYDYELIASTEPCAMCYGATPWSGVTRLVCGAKKEDAQAVGFDEGNKPSDWQAGLTARGITVTCEIEREQAAKILQDYKTAGRTIY